MVKQALNVYQNCLWKNKVPVSLYKVWRLHVKSTQFPHYFQLNLDFGLVESKTT